MASEFVHLRVHSEYSMSEGSILRVGRIAAAAKAGGMRAVALTDAGNMFGAVQFHEACKEAGVGEIFGCELEVRAEDASARNSPYQLVLLARGQDGYRSLVCLASLGAMRGPVGAKP
ncbi:MAG: hypothetical protein RLZZ450_5903, partial [Pseudomonadota bacterium]